MTSSLVRMRLHGYWRSGRAVPPLVTALVVIASLYGGGAEPAGEGFGLSAYILLPVLALQTKLLIDAEPDVARKMIVVCVGRRGDVLAGLLAAAVAGLAMIMIAIVLPFAIGGIAVHAPGPPFAAGFVLGIWAHLLILLPALALGALTSRAVTGSIGVGALALVGGWICMMVADLPRSPIRWLAPPMIDIARAARANLDGSLVSGLTAWTLGWTAVAIAGYAILRRHRA